MDFNSTSLDSILSRLATVLENMGDGALEKPAIPYTMNQLLETAIDNRASMLHINAGNLPMLRIGDQLVPVGDYKLTRGDCQKLLYPLLNKEQRYAVFSGEEVEGYFSSSGLGFKLNIYKERGNLSASIRRLRSDIPTLENLNLATDKIQSSFQSPSGLILLSGLPHSGKIATLASFISHINSTRNARVISIEDSIKFWHQSNKSTIIQREVGSDTRSFSHAMQQAVLQDPDVIVISDIPDKETAEFVIKAASGGHLVIASLHASNNIKAIETIHNTFENDSDYTRLMIAFSQSLLLSISQTMVPPNANHAPVPIYEIMENNLSIAQSIRAGDFARIPEIIKNEKMQTLSSSLRALIQKGIISREEALHIVNDPKELDIPLEDASVSDDKPVAEKANVDADNNGPNMLGWL